MALPDDYLAALETLALAFEAYGRISGGTAVLVGGAAAAIYTGWMFPSNDFDIVAADDVAFEQAMLGQGFEREAEPGLLRGGFWHPRHPHYGFQQVSGALFDGRAERGRLVRLAALPVGEAALVLPAIEDMIVDRLAQHAVAPPGDDSRLLQAKALFSLAENLDIGYLSRRIGDEGGDPGLLGIAA
jgi:hypothetical protein